MSQATSLATSCPDAEEGDRSLWTALIQVLLLTFLWVLLIRDEYPFLAMRIFGDSEAAHALAAPVLISLLVYRRWNLLVDAMRPGSVWGIVVVGLAIMMFAVFTWPFFIGYPRQASIVVAVAGFILSVAGWRVLKLCVPMLVILLLAVPIGWRQYAFLIVGPETYTFAAMEFVLNLLPGVLVSMDGPDIFFSGSQGTGAIALGEPHRGASLFLAMAMIGAFVTYARIRPLWQFVAVAVFAAPILLFCNFMRLFAHSVITIYGNFDALSPVPRLTAGAFALLLAYGLFLVVLWVLNSVVQPVEQTADIEADAGATRS